MFSLITAYDDSQWEVGPGEFHRGDFSLSRYLEYTDSSIEEKLKPVSDETLGFLSGIPAIFISEMKTDREGPLGDFITMRIGRVSNLTVVGNEIIYSFLIEHDLGRITIENRTRFEAAFRLGRWELTRTHWAVKSGDLMEALTEAGLADRINDNGPNIRPSLQEPPEERRPDQPIVDSVQGFLEEVLSYNPAPNTETFYRGHSDRKYRLEPRLFRKNERGEFRHLQKESTLVREILTAQANEFASDQYMLDRLVRMQHYGLPTRLLDVTSNPLMGLYFCCSGAKVDGDGQEVDGEVIILSTNSKNVRFFDSDTVSCVTNLSLMAEAEQEALDRSLSKALFNELPACQSLLHFIKREKPYFEPRIEPEDLDRILFVRGRNTNERIISQSGAFLLFGKDAILPETGHSSLTLQRITVRNKAEILEQLAKLNIKSSTVFPGIEKATAEIASKYELV